MIAGTITFTFSEISLVRFHISGDKVCNTFAAEWLSGLRAWDFLMQNARHVRLVTSLVWHKPSNKFHSRDLG